MSELLKEPLEKPLENISLFNDLNIEKNKLGLGVINYSLAKTFNPDKFEKNKLTDDDLLFIHNALNTNLGDEYNYLYDFHCVATIIHMIKTISKDENSDKISARNLFAHYGFSKEFDALMLLFQPRGGADEVTVFKPDQIDTTYKTTLKSAFLEFTRFLFFCVLCFSSYNLTQKLKQTIYDSNESKVIQTIIATTSNMESCDSTNLSSTSLLVAKLGDMSVTSFGAENNNPYFSNLLKIQECASKNYENIVNKIAIETTGINFNEDLNTKSAESSKKEIISNTLTVSDNTNDYALVVEGYDFSFSPEQNNEFKRIAKEFITTDKEITDIESQLTELSDKIIIFQKDKNKGQIKTKPDQTVIEKGKNTIKLEPTTYELIKGSVTELFHNTNFYNAMSETFIGVNPVNTLSYYLKSYLLEQKRNYTIARANAEFTMEKFLLEATHGAELMTRLAWAYGLTISFMIYYFIYARYYFNRIIDLIQNKPNQISDQRYKKITNGGKKSKKNKIIKNKSRKNKKNKSKKNKK